jgi:hypothetical protein
MLTVAILWPAVEIESFAEFSNDHLHIKRTTKLKLERLRYLGFGVRVRVA